MMVVSIVGGSLVALAVLEKHAGMHINEEALKLGFTVGAFGTILYLLKTIAVFL